MRSLRRTIGAVVLLSAVAMAAGACVYVPAGGVYGPPPGPVVVAPPPPPVVVPGYRWGWWGPGWGWRHRYYW